MSGVIKNAHRVLMTSWSEPIGRLENGLTWPFRLASLNKERQGRPARRTDLEYGKCELLRRRIFLQGPATIFGSTDEQKSFSMAIRVTTYLAVLVEIKNAIRVATF